MQQESAPVKKLKSSSKAPKKQKENKEAAKKKEISGVIYVGHLPYGFVEEGLKNYFEQYGEVLRVKLMRSKRTARSRGFGFVEFLDKEVAEIAVKSMNGYMMFGTRLECRLLDKSEEHGNLFIRSNKKFKFIPWHVIYQKNMNRERTDEQVVSQLKNLLSADAKKIAQLKTLGIDYKFTQYKDL